MNDVGSSFGYFATWWVYMDEDMIDFGGGFRGVRRAYVRVDYRLMVGGGLVCVLLEWLHKRLGVLHRLGLDLCLWVLWAILVGWGRVIW